MPNTPEPRTSYAHPVEQWKQQNQGCQPSMDLPFPLSPGTYNQSCDVCMMCGRGFHYLLDCKAVGDQPVTEYERQMRSVILCSMQSRSAGRGEARVMAAGQWQPIQFEVLHARGRYNLLLGKPWLPTVGAAQVLVNDKILLAGPDRLFKLKNDPDLEQHPSALSQQSAPPKNQLTPTIPMPVMPNLEEQTAVRKNPDIASEQPTKTEAQPGEPVPVCRS